MEKNENYKVTNTSIITVIGDPHISEEKLNEELNTIQIDDNSIIKDIKYIFQSSGDDTKDDTYTAMIIFEE
jgi:hypothetical protein